MEASEVRGIIHAQLASFGENTPQSTIGTPWSEERLRSEVERLRDALVEPRLATVRIGNAKAGPDALIETRALWIVTQTVENGYLVVFDPESREFGLAIAGGSNPETVSVWGDLVGTFSAR